MVWVLKSVGRLKALRKTARAQESQVMPVSTNDNSSTLGSFEVVSRNQPPNSNSSANTPRATSTFRRSDS